MQVRQRLENAALDWGVRRWLPVLLLLLAAPVQAQLAAARAHIAAEYPRIIDELVMLTEIPAPPFGEQARGQRFAEMLRAAGLRDVRIDEAGNVIALRPGRDRGQKLLVVSAHLDTVFPRETPIKVVREGTVLRAPGIGDDTVGLAALLAWVRALEAARVETPRDLLFVATVGEEGQGDLRGVKALFAGPRRDRIGDFISFDGAAVRGITNGAVGSKRYAVAFTGPGGHSYGAFGIVNPMVAMAAAVTGLYAEAPPADIKTTYAASTVVGGTSVNSIPNAVMLEVDMRSRAPGHLAALEARFLKVVADAVAAENAARDTRFGVVAAEAKLIGDRPAGETPASDPLVVAARAVLARNGYEDRLNASSTDANTPISLGVPAITLGTGAGGGRAHALDEFVDVDEAPFVKGLQTGLEVVLAAAAIRR